MQHDVLFFPVLIRIRTCRYGLVKIARIKFTKIHPVTVEVFHANRKGGRTSGHDEANSHFSQTPRIDA